MKRIGIFGGTYNPPHIGHLNIVNDFISKYNLDKVLIIPTYIPPHKTSAYLVSCEDRMEMCKRTFKDDIFEVSSLEIERQGKSYTVDTLKELIEKNQDSEFFLLIGDDMLTTFHEWRKPKEILKMCTVVSAIRSNSLSTQALIDYAEKNYPTEYKNGKFKFLYMEPIKLSSTEIRKKIASGESIKGLVSPEAYEYIESRGLYHD